MCIRQLFSESNGIHLVDGDVRTCVHVHAWIQKVLSEGVQLNLFFLFLVDDGKKDPAIIVDDDR